MFIMESTDKLILMKRIQYSFRDLLNGLASWYFFIEDDFSQNFSFLIWSDGNGAISIG